MTEDRNNLVCGRQKLTSHATAHSMSCARRVRLCPPQQHGTWDLTWDFVGHDLGPVSKVGRPGDLGPWIPALSITEMDQSVDTFFAQTFFLTIVSDAELLRS